MQTYNFTFNAGDGDWGWNSVLALNLKSAVKKAADWVKKNFPAGTLDVGSVNCNASTEKALLRLFY